MVFLVFSSFHPLYLGNKKQNFQILTHSAFTSFFEETVNHNEEVSWTDVLGQKKKASAPNNG